MMNALPVDLLLSPLILALLGLAIGSFLNVVIHRLPLMLERGWKLESAELLGVQIDPPAPIGLAQPRSRCPACGHAIAWHENIPILSYLRLRGRCAACGAPIAARYPLVEAGTAVLFAAVSWRFGAHPTMLLWCGFVALLVALAVIDWDTTLLPDNLTLPLLWAGLVASACGWTLPLPTALWGAVAGYAALWVVYWLFKLTTGKEGMGYGDFKLLAALGAWLGWQMILPVVLAASLIGALVGIAMKLSGALREGRYVPFGPFLASAGIAVMLAGSERVLDWLGWG
jgi:leader peptidase (prepilin peptidase)/N-methyltransferase